MSAVPQSLLEALEDECKQFIHTKCRREAGGVRFAIIALTRWFAAHDVVEVVRCGECVHLDVDFCEAWDHYLYNVQFCSRGERRTDESSS